MQERLERLADQGSPKGLQDGRSLEAACLDPGREKVL